MLLLILRDIYFCTKFQIFKIFFEPFYKIFEIQTEKNRVIWT